MLEEILGIFKGSKLSFLANAISMLVPIVADLEKNYINNKDAKNAIIDTLIHILESYKDNG